uniref:Uncharacterized protein n=1 Tax=Chrysemys picta bellii TaxID=8478 RepID=A0A8C3IH19_CHRPI
MLPQSHGGRAAEGSGHCCRASDTRGAGTICTVGLEDEEDIDSPLDPDVPHPDLAPVVFFCLKQTTSPRNWCIKMVCNPYPFRPLLGDRAAFPASQLRGHQNDPHPAS